MGFFAFYVADLVNKKLGLFKMQALIKYKSDDELEEPDVCTGDLFEETNADARDRKDEEQTALLKRH